MKRLIPTTVQERKMNALAEFLEVDADTINTTGYDLSLFETESGREYRVFDDAEREAEVQNYIEDSLWAFTPYFLSEQTGIDKVVFGKLAELCEDANDAVRSIIDATCGIEEFTENAVEADGYGSFLSPYDGNEDEVSDGDQTFYVYRVS